MTTEKEINRIMAERKRIKQALAKVLEDDIDMVVDVLTDWIREHGYALCIFNPEEVESCELGAKGIESAMMEEGCYTVRHFGGKVGEELEEEEEA